MIKRIVKSLQLNAKGGVSSLKPLETAVKPQESPSSSPGEVQGSPREILSKILLKILLLVASKTADRILVFDMFAV